MSFATDAEAFAATRCSVDDRESTAEMLRLLEVGSDAPRCAGLLAGMLDLAVPLWIVELRALTFEERAERARRGVQVICESGDVLMYGSGIKPKAGQLGKTGEAFNAVACGLAALAYQPGGVKFLGRHWEVREP
jgi:hypothetical protein